MAFNNGRISQSVKLISSLHIPSRGSMSDTLLIDYIERLVARANRSMVLSHECATTSQVTNWRPTLSVERLKVTEVDPEFICLDYDKLGLQQQQQQY